MKNKLITFLYCIIFLLEPHSGPRISPVMEIENEVIYSVRLPDWAITCTRTTVYAKPDQDSKILYQLPQGKRVRIREGSRNNAFAMINLVEWVRTVDLCKDR